LLAQVIDFARTRWGLRLKKRCSADLVYSQQTVFCGCSIAIMFLRAKIRRKDGKEHRTWSLVENKRVSGGRVVQRHVLYLGEINPSQEVAWRKSIEVLEDGVDRPRTASRGSVHPGRRRLL
jgi:hypothetical protein